MTQRTLPLAKRPDVKGAFENAMALGMRLPGNLGFIARRKLKRRQCARMQDTFSEVLADLQMAIAVMRRFKPGLRVILTVSPVPLTATASEIVVELPVAEGTDVKAGDVLVALDNSLQMAKLSLAEAELEKARATLLKLQVGPRAEEIAIAEARVAEHRRAFGGS